MSLGTVVTVAAGIFLAVTGYAVLSGDYAACYVVGIPALIVWRVVSAFFER